MPLWGKNDDANSAPKFTAVAATGTSGKDAFGNVTVGAFVEGASVGVFGVDPTEARLSDPVVSPGWVTMTVGTGPVVALAVSDGGVDYEVDDVIEVSGGVVNASAKVATVDANGTITSVTLVDGGSGFTNVATASVTSNAGANADIIVILGGRAGRVTSETLVSMRTITGDAGDDALLPDS